jgi:3-oxoadipate enol-lactonase
VNVTEVGRRIALVAALLLVCVASRTLATQQMTKGLANVNGTRLAYEAIGKGFPLVLISGGGTLDKRGWDDQFTTFAKFFRVIRYDIRGIGESAQPDAPFSHSDDLYALLNLLRVQTANLVGLSFGGSIALDFAIEHPEMVDRLVLAAAGTSSDARADANLQALAGLGAVARKDGLSQAIRLILDTPTFISSDNSAARKLLQQNYTDNARVFESDFALVRLWRPIDPPARQRLSEVRARVLILQGENDSAASRSMSDQLLAIAGAKKMVIAGAAHAINLDKPDDFNTAALDFLMKK